MSFDAWYMQDWAGRTIDVLIVLWWVLFIFTAFLKFFDQRESRRRE